MTDTRPVPRPAWRRCKVCGWDTFDPHEGEVCRWCDNTDIKKTYNTGAMIIAERDGKTTVGI